MSTKAKPKRQCPKCLKGDNLLLWLTLLGVFGGIGLGLVLKVAIKDEPTLAPRNLLWLKLPGDMFLNALKLIILPLITSSLINSMQNLNSKNAGRIGLTALIYYMSTTILAVILGIVLIATIQPGVDVTTSNQDDSFNNCEGIVPGDTIMDLLLNLVPDNLIEAMLQADKACLKYVYYEGADKNERSLSVQQWKVWKSNLSEWDPEETSGFPPQNQTMFASPFREASSGMNVLGIVFFSLTLGFVIAKSGDDGKPLADLFRSLETVCMSIIRALIWVSPIGIMFLIAGAMLGMMDLLGQLRKLGLYMAVVISGLLTHACVVLPLILFFLGKRNPLKFSWGMLQAYLTAFGTSSSSATMPVTLECLEKKIGIPKEITRFVIPLGATVNMDGTALYEAAAALYIAQVVGRNMNIGEMIMISITATLASVGAAGIPQAGMVTSIMVLTAVGLNPALFVLIVPIDWFLDRIRTVVNVHGDAYGCAVVQRFANLPDDDLEGVHTAPFDDELDLNTAKSIKDALNNKTANQNKQSKQEEFTKKSSKEHKATESKSVDNERPNNEAKNEPPPPPVSNKKEEQKKDEPDKKNKEEDKTDNEMDQNTQLTDKMSAEGESAEKAKESTSPTEPNPNENTQMESLRSESGSGTEEKSGRK